MAKIFLTLFLFATLGTFLPTAQAADPEMKFEVTRDNSKDYRWQLKGPDGKVLAIAATGHKQHADAMAGLELFRKVAAELHFDIFLDESAQYRWRLVSEKGETLAVSNGGYKAEAEADRAITALRIGAGKAGIMVRK